jgi:hypothetical protein
MTAARCLFATAGVRQRITSTLVDGFSTWWEMPALVLSLAALAAIVVLFYRRDARELSRPVRAGLAALRLGALAALVAAYLDVERTSEREIESPSRVAVLVDTSASMALTDPAGGGTSPPRCDQAVAALDAGGLLEALQSRQDVSVWRFDATAERIALLPRGGFTVSSTVATTTDTPPAGSRGGDWRDRLAAQGSDTRLGDALARVLDEEPAGTLAGVILLTDGISTAGTDPRAAAAAIARAGVAVHPLGIGSELVPPAVRVADMAAPARVFPSDPFTVTAHLQAQGMAGQTVRVDLPAAADAAVASPTPLDTVDAVLGADGELVAVRFDVAGLAAAGRRTLGVRAIPTGGRQAAATDRMTTDIEVVDRVTRVLLMAGGPSREYQFMRNVLQRDPSFSVDVLLGTATPGVSQDARQVLDAFPASDQALADYDAIAAFDYDWRQLDLAARSRLERWVARESGGLLLVAGTVFMEAWLAEPQMGSIRNLFPLELRGRNQIARDEGGGGGEPRPVRFTREGADAEFLWAAATRGGSEGVWGEFPGVFGRCPNGPAKPGATVYMQLGTAQLADGGRGVRLDVGSPIATADNQSAFLVGQLYGAGTVLFVGSGELWRLRSVDAAAHERLTTQIVRHVAQGRLLRGSRRGRLLVDRDRYAVGGTVTVRLMVPEGSGATPATTCRVIGPDGGPLPVPLAAEPGRADMLRGSFVAAREGAWRVEADLGAAGDDEPLARTIHAQLPDRELAQPRIDRRILDDLAATTGGRAWFLHDVAWTQDAARTLAASLPDRSRREYEAGAPDVRFKQWLNGLLVAIAVGLLCGEWILRRLVTLA